MLHSQFLKYALGTLVFITGLNALGEPVSPIQELKNQIRKIQPWNTHHNIELLELYQKLDRLLEQDPHKISETINNKLYMFLILQAILQDSSIDQNRFHALHQEITQALEKDCETLLQDSISEKTIKNYTSIKSRLEKIKLPDLTDETLIKYKKTLGKIQEKIADYYKNKKIADQYPWYYESITSYLDIAQKLSDQNEKSQFLDQAITLCKNLEPTQAIQQYNLAISITLNTAMQFQKQDQPQPAATWFQKARLYQQEREQLKEIVLQNQLTNTPQAILEQELQTTHLAEEASKNPDVLQASHQFFHAALQSEKIAFHYVVAASPSLPQPPDWITAVLHQAEKWHQNTVHYYTNAALKNPEKSIDYYHRAAIYSEKVAKNYQTNKSFEKAIAWYQRAAENHLQSNQPALAGDAYQQAAQSQEQWLPSIKPENDNPYASFLLGRQSETLANYHQKATQSYLKANLPHRTAEESSLTAEWFQKAALHYFTAAQSSSLALSALRYKERESCARKAEEYCQLTAIQHFETISTDPGKHYTAAHYALKQAQLISDQITENSHDSLYTAEWHQFTAHLQFQIAQKIKDPFYAAEYYEASLQNLKQAALDYQKSGTETALNQAAKCYQEAGVYSEQIAQQFESLATHHFKTNSSPKQCALAGNALFEAAQWHKKVSPLSLEAKKLHFTEKEIQLSFPSEKIVQSYLTAATYFFEAAQHSRKKPRRTYHALAELALQQAALSVQEIISTTHENQLTLPTKEIVQLYLDTLSYFLKAAQNSADPIHAEKCFTFIDKILKQFILNDQASKNQFSVPPEKIVQSYLTTATYFFQTAQNYLNTPDAKKYYTLIDKILNQTTLSIQNMVSMTKTIPTENITKAYQEAATTYLEAAQRTADPFQYELAGNTLKQAVLSEQKIGLIQPDHQLTIPSNEIAQKYQKVATAYFEAAHKTEDATRAARLYESAGTISEQIGKWQQEHHQDDEAMKWYQKSTSHYYEAAIRNPSQKNRLNQLAETVANQVTRHYQRRTSEYFQKP